MRSADIPPFVVLSGCSGGGKSSLLEALGRRGFATVPEPGRRILAEERANEGKALPWRDLEGFLQRALSLARRDYAGAAQAPQRTFFDRGLVDAAVGLRHLSGGPLPEDLPRYHHKVFLVPPWPDIYVQDQERQHGLAEAITEYERLIEASPQLGYDITVVPHASVEERADFVLDALGWV